MAKFLVPNSSQAGESPHTWSNQTPQQRVKTVGGLLSIIWLFKKIFFDFQIVIIFRLRPFTAISFRN